VCCMPSVTLAKAVAECFRAIAECLALGETTVSRSGNK